MPVSSATLTPGQPHEPDQLADHNGSGSDFAGLSSLIKKAGLLKRRPGYYLIRFSIVIGCFVAGWTAFVLLGDSRWNLLVAVLLGLLFTQLAFLGHDIGHRQVFRSRRTCEMVGLVIGNLALGMSYGWWVNKHNRHHANPNHEDHDPDIAVGVIAWTEEHARNKRGPLRWMAKHQAWFFFPLLLLEGIQLHVAGFRALAGKEMKRKLLEGTLLSAHVVIYLTTLFVVLSPGKALLFIAIHQGLFGLYMGCSFAPNHKGMPIISGKLDFLRKQVLTSRNVRGNIVVDYLLGGLNYQIEHHLFPSMPMPNLRKARPLVREYCARIGIAYEEASIVRSYREVLENLHSVGASIRRPAVGTSIS